VKICEFLTNFKIRKKIVKSVCLFSANFIWAIAILDECSSVNAQPKARVVFEHGPLDLTQINNRLALLLCL